MRLLRQFEAFYFFYETILYTHKAQKNKKHKKLKKTKSTKRTQSKKGTKSTKKHQKALKALKHNQPKAKNANKQTKIKNALKNI